MQIAFSAGPAAESTNCLKMRERLFLPAKRILKNFKTYSTAAVETTQAQCSAKPYEDIPKISFARLIFNMMLDPTKRTKIHEVLH